jgi:hypothetical protein
MNNRAHRFLLLLLFAALPSVAQQQIPSGIPSPREILGYDLGDRYSSHDAIERYVTALHGAAPDRIAVIPYGESYERRSLFLVVITSPDNLKSLGSIRGNIHKLTDPRGITGSEADRIIESTPPVVWLSYGVHGNEASSSEAALNVMYRLLAAGDSATSALLRSVVVVIDPLLNPDGHERYVNFQTTHTGLAPVEDRAAAEHNEDWPSGRTNHYLFDLNRDWAWMTQQESRARVKIYREWMPQVHVDFHEMWYNSSYFFFPSFKPVNKNFPASTVAWGKIFGKANAAAFDNNGWSYYSGESFDLFYPGYGDSWPSFHGAIGMTYEQAGQTGLTVRRADDTFLTLKDRLEHHSAASFATLQTAAEHRQGLLRDFYRYFLNAITEGAGGTVKEFFVDPSRDPSRAAKMITLLLDQGIEVRRSATPFTATSLHGYFSGGTGSHEFPAGSYIIPMNQPARNLAMALLEPEPVFSDTFFYDISTWCLPLACGVETFWSGKEAGAAFNAIAAAAPPAGDLTGAPAAYAYLMPWSSNDAIGALAGLLQRGLIVKVALRPFALGGLHYPRGTLIIPVAGNPARLDTILRPVAQRFHINLTGTNTGFAEEGIDLGSDRAVRLKKPNIIVATNAPVNPESFGAIWSMFDTRYHIPFVPMKLQQIKNTDLHDYTVIIFPDDNAGGRGYKSQFDSAAVQKLRSWVAGGGTFIGIEGGAAFASISKLASLKIKEKEKDSKDSTKPGQLSEEDREKRMTVEEKERKERLESIPGTILRVKIDTSHPLGFGYDTAIAVFKSAETVYDLSEHGYNAGIYAKAPRMSGYISAENEKLVRETPFVVHEQLGTGNLVLFADDPNFRLFWDGLNKLFFNSVLIMPSIRNVMMTSGGRE